MIPQSVRSESKRKYQPVEKVVKEMHSNELCHKISLEHNIKSTF
jgi:hypothetical protein